jgi:diguanylate cyclase (GGDEF)-like protein/PAS domain S-box-containing protein
MTGPRPPSSPGVRHPLLRLVSSVWAVPVATIVIVGTVLSWFAYDGYRRTIEHEVRFLDAHVRIAEADLNGLLRNFDQMLTQLAAERLDAAPGSLADFEAALLTRKKDFPEVRTLLLTDARGRIEISSNPRVKGVDASGREYFTHQKTRAPNGSLFVSRPFTASIGEISITISRAIIDDKGVFRGVVGAGVDPRVFEPLLRSIRPDENGAATTLLNSYGDIIYRWPDAESRMGKNVGDGPVFKAFQASAARSFHQIGNSKVDGVGRLFVFRRIGDSGLSVNVSRDLDDILASWRSEVERRMAIFVLISAMVLFLASAVRKRQDDLVAAKEYSERLIETANVMVVGLDSEGCITIFNEAAERVSGYSRDEVLGRNWFDILVPRDRFPKVWTVFCDLRQRGCLVRNYENPILTKDGRELIIEWQNSVLIENGEPATTISFGLDVTERKKTEEELQLAASIFNVSSEGMLVTDAENRIIAINPAMEKLSGYTLAELAGRDPRIFKSGRHDKAFYQEMWQSIINTGTWQGEIWDRHKNGAMFAKHMIIKTLHNGDGSVHRRIAFCSDITARKQAEETIWRQANFDTLTGLPNRRLFHDRLEQEMIKTQRTDQTLALLFIDLDHFKEVNDTRGHDLGDLLLTEAARRISACVRVTDTLARLGGDEFTVVLAGLDDGGLADHVAQSILHALEQPFLLRGENIYISASIGITLYPNDASDLDTLLKNADQAMYVAKERGRNGFSYFVATMQQAALERQDLIRDLRNALPAGQLEVHYQPIVDLASGRICKAEALLRWRHPQRGMISPAVFIPLAEETGLIHEIGDWVFRQSAAVARRWLAIEDDGAPIAISVNKSPRQFIGGRTHRDWLEHLAQIGLPPECIVIEITEGLLLDARVEVREKLRQFRDSGVRISLDDFGTGFSAMAYLKRFHLDFLKIDQSFVRDMHDDPNDQAIVEAIIVMAHKLGLKVVAEGVETLAQRKLLVGAGCDYAQGYLFARPMPAAEFEALLKSALALQ